LEWFRELGNAVSRSRPSGIDFFMANTLTVGKRARPSILLGVSIVINMIAVIAGGSLSAHASAHQEYDWAIFFFLLSLLNAAMALVSSKSN
jgi:hypothetical protein